MSSRFLKDKFDNIPTSNDSAKTREFNLQTPKNSEEHFYNWKTSSILSDEVNTIERLILNFKVNWPSPLLIKSNIENNTIMNKEQLKKMKRLTQDFKKISSSLWPTPSLYIEMAQVNSDLSIKLFWEKKLCGLSPPHIFDKILQTERYSTISDFSYHQQLLNKKNVLTITLKRFFSEVRIDKPFVKRKNTSGVSI